MRLKKILFSKTLPNVIHLAHALDCVMTYNKMSIFAEMTFDQFHAPEKLTISIE